DAPNWAVGCGLAGAAFACVAGVVARRGGPLFAAVSIVLVIAVAGRWLRPTSGDPWLAYAFELVAMLCLVVSGMLDGVRARAVAGWIGLAAVIAAITWAVQGSLLSRSVFLGVAGAVAIALSTLLGRLLPRESRP